MFDGILVCLRVMVLLFLGEILLYVCLSRDSLFRFNNLFSGKLKIYVFGCILVVIFVCEVDVDDFFGDVVLNFVCK